MARRATSAQARLVHDQLAALYNLKAAIGDAMVWALIEPMLGKRGAELRVRML